MMIEYPNNEELFLLADSGKEAPDPDRIFIFGRSAFAMWIHLVLKIFIDAHLALLLRILLRSLLLWGNATGSSCCCFMFFCQANPKKIYSKMFRMIRNLYPNFKPTSASLDYELGVMNALYGPFEALQNNSKSDDSRRRRTECSVELRRQKRNDEMMKRRNLTIEADDSDTSVTSDTQDAGGKALSTELMSVDTALAILTNNPTIEDLRRAFEGIRKLLSRSKDPPVDEVIKLDWLKLSVKLFWLRMRRFSSMPLGA
uniref:IBB domain-containing protein n=1 Tax=Ditylenchus dipsaci TaxID=166011 RepID=A0A915E077_9BILA